MNQSNKQALFCLVLFASLVDEADCLVKCYVSDQSRAPFWFLPPTAWMHAHTRKLCSDVRRKVKYENACSPLFYLFLAQSADRKHQTWLFRHLAAGLKGLEGEENITRVLIKCEQHLERGTKGHRSFISETRGYFTIHCLVTSQINQWPKTFPLLVLQTF